LKRFRLWSANDDDTVIHDVWHHGFPGCQKGDGIDT